MELFEPPKDIEKLSEAIDAHRIGYSARTAAQGFRDDYKSSGDP